MDNSWGDISVFIFKYCLCCLNYTPNDDILHNNYVFHEKVILEKSPIYDDVVAYY